MPPISRFVQSLSDFAKPLLILATTLLILLRSHCHTLIILHPFARKPRSTLTSRARLLSIFAFQNALLDFGMRRHFGQPCQKQPSTKTASFCFRNAKSGVPSTGKCLRQPLMRLDRRCLERTCSVAALFLPRIRDIISDRFERENTSIAQF